LAVNGRVVCDHIYIVDLTLRQAVKAQKGLELQSSSRILKLAG